MSDVEEMARAEVESFLSRSSLAHLGLARGGHAYVIPVFYRFDGRHVYFRSHHGLKDDYLRATEEACMVVTNVVSDDDWQSVHVFGHVRAANLTPEIAAGLHALELTPQPPAPAGGPARARTEGAVLWRLDPTKMVGRRSRPPALN